jgi:hypothetical membrane protein
MSNTAFPLAAVSGPSTASSAADAAGWRPLVLVGSAGPVVFFALATLGGALTPDYNPLTDTISAIALGPVGWLQTLNFYLFGGSVIAFGLALGRRFAGDKRVAASGLLLALSGLSLITAGAFPAILTDGEPTPSALIHGLAFFGTCLPVPGAYALLAVRLAQESGWRRFSTYSAALPSTVFFLFALFGVLGSDPRAPLLFVGGLLQRLLLGVAFSWITLLGIRLWRPGTPARTLPESCRHRWCANP